MIRVQLVRCASCGGLWNRFLAAMAHVALEHQDGGHGLTLVVCEIADDRGDNNAHGRPGCRVISFIGAPEDDAEARHEHDALQQETWSVSVITPGVR